MAKEITEKQLEIIKIVCELPPVANIFFMSATNDQKRRWVKENNYWQIIALGLKGHFSGEGYELHLKPILEENIPRFLRLDVEKWNSFYDLLSFNWSEITSYLDKQNLAIFYRSEYECLITDANPGDVFTYILEQKSYYSFAECLEKNYTFKPQQFYNDYQAWKRITSKLNKLTKDNLTASQLKTKKRLIEKLTTNSQRNQFKEGAYLQQLLIDILSKSRNKDTKRNLKEYSNICAESELAHLDSFQSRNKPQAYKWDNGILRLGKKGGFA